MELGNELISRRGEFNFARKRGFFVVCVFRVLGGLFVLFQGPRGTPQNGGNKVIPKTVATHKSTYLYLSTARFYQMLPGFYQIVIGIGGTGAIIRPAIMIGGTGAEGGGACYSVIDGKLVYASLWPFLEFKNHFQEKRKS